MHNFEIHPIWLILSGIGLALVPLLVPIITGWTKITIILGFIRNGIGFQHTGAAIVDGSMALLIAMIISAPVYSSILGDLEVAYQEVKSSRAPGFQQIEKISQIIRPWREFLERNSGSTELQLANSLIIDQISDGRDNSKNEDQRAMNGLGLGELINYSITLDALTKRSCIRDSMTEVACTKEAAEKNGVRFAQSISTITSRSARFKNLVNDKYYQEGQIQPINNVSKEGYQSPILASILAFFLTEIREGLVLGLKILIPFLVVDFVVANLLAGMGMFLLSPQVITLPLKVLLFLGAGGYTLLTQGAVLGYVY